MPMHTQAEHALSRLKSRSQTIEHVTFLLKGRGTNHFADPVALAQHYFLHIKTPTLPINVFSEPVNACWMLESHLVTVHQRKF